MLCIFSRDLDCSISVVATKCVFDVFFAGRVVDLVNSVLERDGFSEKVDYQAVGYGLPTLDEPYEGLNLLSFTVADGVELGCYHSMLSF
jgi:hypothetical protein